MLFGLPPEILRDFSNNIDELPSQTKRAVEQLQETLLKEGVNVSDDDGEPFH